MGLVPSNHRFCLCERSSGRTAWGHKCYVASILSTQPNGEKRGIMLHTSLSAGQTCRPNVICNLFLEVLFLELGGRLDISMNHDLTRPLSTTDNAASSEVSASEILPRGLQHMYWGPKIDASEWVPTMLHNSSAGGTFSKQSIQIFLQLLSYDTRKEPTMCLLALLLNQVSERVWYTPDW